MTEQTAEAEKRADACDVVVVGAGIVGAVVAARLVLEGLETAVLEAQEIAGGATGRCSGMVLTGLPCAYSEAIATYGREMARELWALTGEGRQRLVASAESLQVPVELTGSLSLAKDEAEAQLLEESAILLTEDGFGATFERGDPLDRGFVAALRTSRDATVDAAALTNALLLSSDAIVHEHTEVHSLEAEGDGVRVWAHGRTVFCNAVVLATDSYAPLLDAHFVDKIAPTSGLLLTTAPLGDGTLKHPLSANGGYTTCRQTENGQLLLGNWWHPSPADDNGSLNAAYEGLREFAARHFPELFVKATQRWPGLGGFTPDGLPLVGRLPDVPQAYYAVGLGIRGLAWAYVLAERVTELLLHQVDPGLLSAARLAPPEADLRLVETTPDLAVLDTGPPPVEEALDLTGTGTGLGPEENTLDLADLVLLDMGLPLEKDTLEASDLALLDAGLPPEQDTLDLADLAFLEAIAPSEEETLDLANLSALKIGPPLDEDALILRDLAFLEATDPSEEESLDLATLALLNAGLSTEGDALDLADLDLLDASFPLEEGSLDLADLAFLETGAWPEETSDGPGDASSGTDTGPSAGEGTLHSDDPSERQDLGPK